MPLLQHLCGYLKGVPQEILEGCGDAEAEGKENATERSIQRNAAVLLLSPVPQTLEQLAAALQTGELQGCFYCWPGALQQDAVKIAAFKTVRDFLHHQSSKQPARTVL